MLAPGRGRGSNYANRDILERTILKKKMRESGFPSFPNLKSIYVRTYRAAPSLWREKVIAFDLRCLPGIKEHLALESPHSQTSVAHLGAEDCRS